jgi:hypothetical protein
MLKILFISLFFISCFDESVPNYSRDEMLGFARAGDPTMEIKVGTIDKALVSCGEYKFPCKIGYMVVIKRLEMKALYYETQQEALESAKFLKAYRARNWVFDDVIGEPILERFVQKHLHAEKPL